MKTLAALIAHSVMLVPAIAAQEGTWAFPGEKGASGERLLDLRFLNQ